jgi:hypothetical protein
MRRLKKDIPKSQSVKSKKEGAHRTKETALDNVIVASPEAHFHPHPPRSLNSRTSVFQHFRFSAV